LIILLAFKQHDRVLLWLASSDTEQDYFFTSFLSRKFFVAEADAVNWHFSVEIDYGTTLL
jgi:hypothetical protein